MSTRYCRMKLFPAEIRNSIAHLDYSNEQLKPFADGTEPSSNGRPDQDCIDAIKENEIVITRMQERIRLLKAEVEGRGSSWLEFQSAEELKDGEERLVNGTGGSDGDVEMEGQERSDAWTDGTFQTGRIVNGEVRMDGTSGVNGATNGASNNTSRRLDDEALRRAMEERMAEEVDDEEGMHL